MIKKIPTETDHSARIAAWCIVLFVGASVAALAVMAWGPL